MRQQLLIFVFVLFSFSLQYDCRNSGGLLGDRYANIQQQAENACYRIEAEPEFP